MYNFGIKFPVVAVNVSVRIRGRELGDTDEIKLNNFVEYERKIAFFRGFLKYLVVNLRYEHQRLWRFETEFIGKCR